MDDVICSVCGTPILTGPVSWDPVTKTATALDATTLPRRRAATALFAEHEKAGRQLMMGEPHIILPGGGRCHERCL